MSEATGLPSRIIIVGASYAGLAVAADLRAAGFAGSLTLIGEEHGRPYHRTQLSKECLADEMPPPRPLRPEAFYGDNTIRHLAGAQVVEIDRIRREVVCADGARHGYEALVLATGARSRRLPDSIDPERRAISLRIASEAAIIAERLQAARRAVIIGAGLIGLEVAAAARSLGIEVTVIEAGDRILRRSLYPALADRVLDRHRRSGIAFALGAQLARVTAEGVSLTTGDSVPADLVLSAIGGTPRDELAAAAGLRCDNGIVTDDRGATEDPAIFAAGDCACWDGRRHESVAAAQAQGRIVAAALTGRAAPDGGPLRLWSTQGALRLQMSGEVDPAAEVSVRDEGDGALLLARRGGAVIAVQALDAARPFAAALAQIVQVEPAHASV